MTIIAYTSTELKPEPSMKVFSSHEEAEKYCVKAINKASAKGIEMEITVVDTETGQRTEWAS